MLSEDLRKLQKAEPFRPFTLHLVNERAIRIPHPEFMMIAPKMRSSIFVVDGDGYGELLNTNLVVNVTFEVAPPSTNGTNGEAG